MIQLECGLHFDFAMQWLRKQSNEEHQVIVNGTDLYINISLLSIVGHGGMGKTTPWQHVYKDEIIEIFDLKMWVCISINFDAKKRSLQICWNLLKKKEKPNPDSHDALQRKFKEEVMSKRFLLVLDDIWSEEEEQHNNKWENVLAPPSCGSLGSKILVTTRMDTVALIFAKVIKKEEIVKLAGLEEDECL
ncbi:hypothetical protein IEQ34_003057 [Dendrobium chrysotoxum]|uniref:NB-ARC domain-containing protein n=1 Tax=Dendrobium chrysotoxum TaxID=161865 RepID=A0AAV7HIN3_DENCH|nr:hypothetical protein IEQ34_003057 [Dendrobium chrysotoxum]